ncbi:MAG: hypothetical protein ABJ239_01970 [Erythrobacter sp.]
MVRKFLILMLALAASSASAQEDYEWEAILVHSELPLYNFAWDEFWPRSFSDNEDDVLSFGCTSRVSFGDWRFTPHPDNEFGDTAWYRFSNYGVFHCAANALTATEREELDSGDFSRGFFAKIGTSSRQGKKFELWVFQQGFVPGSDYLLLARPVDDDGIIKVFNVLQSRCPKSNIRRSDHMDVWLTSYCSINDRTELLSFAKRMLKEPDLGRLELVPNEKGPDTEVSDPSQVSNED